MRDEPVLRPGGFALTDRALVFCAFPPGARILLNGEARGVTPAQIDGICSGRVRVEVKHAAGKFIKDLVLSKDEAVSLDCPIRPTLAFLGVEAASAAEPPRKKRRERARSATTAKGVLPESLVGTSSLAPST